MRILFLILFLTFFVSCSTQTNNFSSSGNWSIKTKNKLNNIIENHKNKNRVVVFDFDNTVICRDIGEATFLQLIKDNLLKPNSFINSFKNADGKNVNTKYISLFSYYDELLSATKYDNNDKEPYSVGYSWVVKAMNRLTLDEVINATEKAWSNNYAKKDLYSLSQSKIVKGKDSLLRPYFYPEITHLIGILLKNNFDVWIISASNVWTVRWMVKNGLNKHLKEAGFTNEVKLENVIGISTLLKNKNDNLNKDQYLMKNKTAYSNFEKTYIKNLKVTDFILPPVSAYYGKVANIMKYIGEKPLLVVGDSPNDLPMLRYADHKLWIARLEKDKYQKLTKRFFDSSWMIQPVLTKKFSGFIKNRQSLIKLFNNKLPLSVESSLKILPEI